MSIREPMQVKAVKVPAVRDYLVKEGLLAEVLPLVPPESRRLLESPPLPTTWIPTAQMYAIYDAVLQLRGPGSVRKLAYDTTIAAYGTLVKKLVSTLLVLTGTTPATLLAKAETLTQLFEKGTSYAWTSTGERSGVVTVGASMPLGPSAWEAFESLAMVAVTFSKVPGKTRVLEVLPGNQAARIAVEW